MHVRLMVPEAHNLHWKVDAFRGIAKVGDYLAGPRHAYGFDIDHYLVHDGTNDTDCRILAQSICLDCPKVVPAAAAHSYSLAAFIKDQYFAMVADDFADNGDRCFQK